MTKPSQSKSLKERRRRKKVKKQITKHPKLTKFVKNQKAENFREGQMGKMRKMLDERQSKADARPFYLKWKDKVVQLFMQKVYRHYHYLKMNLKKRIAFLRGYKI